jgi:predicted metal-binding membrane protein
MMPAPAIANAWSVRSLRREDMIVVVAMAVLVVASWLYLIYLVQSVPMTQTAETGVTAMTMAMPRVWTSIEVAGLVVMWSVMMIAMMIPTAAPMILVFAAVHRRREAAGATLAIPTAIFVLGYLVVWSVFGIVAALAQAGLHTAALLSPEMVATSPTLAGMLLIAAGIFQWTPLKRACLAACRSPLSFLMTGWREGGPGAFLMGLRHGGYCLGCCWALMALLFVVGVMNLLWVSLIAAFVLVEKLVQGPRLGRLAGVLLVAWGLYVLLPL